ncbi:helix-turn-helix domain-containing protein [Streptococcus uberis]|uniref:helix-turn-helix domain-containing protein n=2 Tax=Streptococcus uberis TaxID=1349 RepID=UPI00215010AA|nr:helix-turn-helix transcriptional regulator [Streptococcus uberis]MCR4257932.1 helix-turn-helix domain-containing protein [Streptococcus uberis]
MTISEKLKTYRKKQGFTQEEVAKRLNVSRTTVSSWETGRTFPDIEKIINLADLYQLSLDQLLREDPQIMKNIKTERRALKHYRLIKKLTLILVGLFCLYNLYWFVMIHPKNTKLNSWQKSDDSYVLNKGGFHYRANKIDYLLGLKNRTITVGTEGEAPFNMHINGDNVYIIVNKSDKYNKDGSTLKLPKDFHFFAKLKKSEIRKDNSLHFDHFEGSIKEANAQRFIEKNRQAFNKEYSQILKVWQSIND